ncbi:MAG: pyruvate dehydrogenase (acetyl-transferring) E1 component subunit alpha [Chloroflexi bacterium]|nr:pyruvate dehydrogenase (acetyl-transferring) E1 component subunit alpha [Chloroflexota bacterium]
MQVQEKVSQQQLLGLHRQMLLIRRFEEKSAEMYMRGKVRGFLHLYIGEEAIAVGAISALRPEDYVVTHYRDHGHALARGMDPNVVMAELFGRGTGSSRGRGGSMHLFDAARNFMGGYAIVGGQLPIATGLALASSYQDAKRVVLCFFGDGAINQGEFHESMNLASLWKLPVIFFLENNMYGMGSHIDRTYAGGRDVYKAAAHYRMPARQIDGMNVLEVREATGEAVEHARAGGGPVFLEAITYRFRGHSMADPMDYRDRAEEEQWRPKDPIVTFRKLLLESGAAREEDIQALERSVEAEVEEAVRFADASPEPPPEALYEDVYA